MKDIEFLEKCPFRTKIRERSSKLDTSNHIDWYDDCGSGHSQLDYGHIYNVIGKYVGKDANKAYSHLLKKYKNSADYNYGYFTIRMLFKNMKAMKNFYKYYIDENNIIRKYEKR